jgi:hypothetical protein
VRGAGRRQRRGLDMDDHLIAGARIETAGQGALGDEAQSVGAALFGAHLLGRGSQGDTPSLVSS